MLIQDLRLNIKQIKKITKLVCVPNLDREYEYSNFMQYFIETKAEYGDFEVLRKPTLNQFAEAQAKLAGQGALPNINELMPIINFSETLLGQEVTKCIKQAAQIGKEAEEIHIEPFPVDNPPASAKVPTAYVPAEHHLNPALADLTIYDVLSILPKAEANLFALGIGRALCGPSGIKFAHSGESYSSPWRYFTLLNGEPKVGKSVLMEQGIIPAMEALGYKTTAYSSLGKQFGVKQIVGSGASLANSDDLNTKSLANLLSSITFKQIVSGGKIRTEEKNKSEETITASAALFASVNQFASEAVWGSDEGAISRLNVLKTYTHTELKARTKKATGLSEGTPHLGTYLHHNYLIEKTGCTRQELYNKFFRLCADYYMGQVMAGTLDREVAENKSYLRYQIPTSVFKSFSELLQLSYLILDLDAEGLNLPPSLSGLSFSQAIQAMSYLCCSNEAHPIRTMIKDDYTKKSRPASHCWTILREINLISMLESADKALMLQPKELLSTTKVIKVLLDDVRLAGSFKIASHLESISKSWTDVRYDFSESYGDLWQEARLLGVRWSAKYDVKHLYSSKFDRDEWSKELASSK